MPLKAGQTKQDRETLKSPVGAKELGFPYAVVNGGEGGNVVIS